MFGDGSIPCGEPFERPTPSPSLPIPMVNPTVRCLRPMALFVSPCSFHHPDARAHLSPPIALTFSVHVQALAADFRRESAKPNPSPPNPPSPNSTLSLIPSFHRPFHRR